MQSMPYCDMYELHFKPGMSNILPDDDLIRPGISRPISKKESLACFCQKLCFSRLNTNQMLPPAAEGQINVKKSL